MKRYLQIIFTACMLMLGLQMGNMKAQAAVTTITEGTYTIKNLGTGKYLNVCGNKDANATNIDVYQKDKTVGQDFKIYKYNSSYAMTPLSSAKARVVNVYTEKAKSGNNVCLWDRTNHSTQLWKFDKVSGGYVIRCADNTKLVLNATGSKNSSNVNIVTYNAKSKNQIWVLEDPQTVKKPETQTQTNTTDSPSTAQTDKTKTDNTEKKAASNLAIKNAAVPSKLYLGDAYSCKGEITSNYVITNVTGQILKDDGTTAVYTKTVDPKGKIYNLYKSKIDEAMLFNKLALGTYYYRVTATDKSGAKLSLIDAKFTVVKPAGLTDAQLKKQIKDTHNKAKKLAKRKSFFGYCGTYVYYELIARKIWTGKNNKYEKQWNGNQWYSKLANKKYTKSSGGYKVTKYSGDDCLDKLSNNGKKEVYNIVVSYKVQNEGTLKNPGAGHVVYIHAIKNGKVYLSESYKYAGIKEGNPIVKKYSSFKKDWKKMYVQANGAVVFSK